MNKNLGLLNIRNGEAIEYNAKWSAVSMLQFVKNYAGDWFLDWSQDVSSRVFLHKIPTLLYFN